MFNEDWYRDKESKKELALGWLYNNQIGNDFAKGYSKNLLDYWSVESAIFGLETQFADDTPYDLCKQAHEAGYSKILVLKQGITLVSYFFDEFIKFYDANKDAKLVGHILDKGEKYYRLHPQTFMFDLNWWADAGFPEWGDWTTESFITIKPERSRDNWHDSYTPKWIAKPDTSIFAMTYKGGEDGWNLIKTLIEDNQKIISWNEEIRDTKFYGYPEVSADGPRHLQEIVDNAVQNDGERFFIANTEYIPNISPHIDSRKSQFGSDQLKEFDCVISPAAGLSPLIYAFELNLKKNGKLLIYDVSRFALNVTKRIVKTWKGENWEDFTHELMNKYIPEGEFPTDHFKGIDKIKYTQENIERLKLRGFQQWIDEVLPTLDIDYAQLNLLDPMSYRRLAREISFHRVSYVHLSNIFHFLPTSFYFSSQQRWDLHNDLVGKLAEQVNNKLTKCEHVLLQSSRGIHSKKWEDNLSGLYWVDDWPTVSFNDLDHKIAKLFKWNK